MHALIPPSEPGQPEPIRPPMVYVERPLRWEYKQATRNLESENPLDEDEPNGFGDDGWELAGVAQHPPFAFYYFKRPTQK